METKVYVDESGNSGRDLYDLNQPIFTCAAVLLDSSQKAEILAELTRLAAAHHLQARAEFKGKSLLKTRGGRKVIRDLLTWMKGHDIGVTVVAVAKPFMAAAVLVEDCTDHFYNSAYDERWTWDTRIKEPLAERISRAADQVKLAKVWEVRDGGDQAAFKAAYESLLFSLSLSIDEIVAQHAVQMQRTDFDDLWNSIQRTSGNSRGYSPNLAAFTSIIQNLELHAEARNLSDLEVIHDEQNQYNKVFEAAWEMFTKSESAKIELPNQSTVVLGLRRLVKLTFADSEIDKGIQIADMVSSGVRVALQEKIENVLDRSTVYIDALQALMRKQLELKNSPFVVGAEGWQLATMTHLLGDPRLQLRR